MRWLDKITPNMTLTDAESALRAAGVEVEKVNDEFADGPELKFDADGFHCTIGVDADGKRVIARGAWRKLPREEALGLIAEAVRGEHPVVVGGRRREHDTQLGWTTPSRHLVLSFYDDDRPAHLRCDMLDEDEPASTRESIAQAGFEWRLRELKELLARTPVPDGDRGAAVARWRTHFESRHRALVRLIEIVQRTSPGAIVGTRELTELEGDVKQLAAHAEQLPGEDDWRDALVVVDGDGREHIPYGDPEQFGWQMELGGEGITGPLDFERRAVLLVQGPFAYGVHRVRGTARELHAVRGDWPVDDVVTEDLADIATKTNPEWLRKYDPDWLRELGSCVATLGKTQVVLMSKMGDVERIATLLACARAGAKSVS